MLSPATLTPSPARRRLIGRGDWLRVLGAGAGTLLRSPGTSPYLRRWGAGDRARALPLCGSGDPGRRPRPGPPTGITCPAGTSTPCPGPLFCVSGSSRSLPTVPVGLWGLD